MGHFAKRAAAKADMYERSGEKAQVIRARVSGKARQQYDPSSAHGGSNGGGWQGQCWGLASTSVRNKKRYKQPRAGASTIPDLPPDEPPSEPPPRW